MKQNKQYECGNIAIGVLVVIMMIVLCILVYLLMGNRNETFVRTGGVSSPVLTPQIGPSETTGFSDNLGTPDEIETFKTDEFGVGITKSEIFNRDINNDGKPDRITRSHYETGNAHPYDEYKIELNNGKRFVDITPDGFRTTEGSECALQKLQFVFVPDFRVIKISRDWQETWDTPTMAYKTTYTMRNNQLTPINTTESGVVCDVTDLFK